MDQTPSASSTGIRCGRFRLLVGAASAVLLAITGTTLTTAAHADPPPTEPIIDTDQTGTHDGYFYAFQKASGDAAMTLGPRGRYRARWSGVSSWSGGKGWATGGRRTFHYCGTYHPSGNSYLTVIGYTENPYTEYYIVENWGTHPPSGTRMGTVVSAGGVYDIYRLLRIGAPGAAPYYQYFSIRQQKRTGGTINTGDHFDAWAQRGMNLGRTMGYMIMATTGSYSGGSSDITVDSDPAAAPACTPGPPSTP